MNTAPPEAPSKRALVTPVSDQSQEIFSKRDHAIIGVSPFNSYFSIENMCDIFSWANNEFKAFDVFIPDLLPIYTFLALGYSNSKAIHKAKRQASYTKNRIIKSLQKTETEYEIKIITMKILRNSYQYTQLRERYLDLFKHNSNFKKNCQATTEWILGKNLPKNNRKINSEIACQYLLDELPIITNTPEIFETKNSIFIYHNTPQIIKDIFNQKIPSTLSVNQGYLTLQFT